MNYITHNGSEHAAVTDLPSKYCLFLEAINLTCKDQAYSLQLHFTVLLTKVIVHVLPLNVCNFTSNYVRHHLPYLSSCDRRLEHSTLIHSSSSSNSSSVGTHNFSWRLQGSRKVLYRTICLFLALVLLLHVRLRDLLEKWCLCFQRAW